MIYTIGHSNRTLHELQSILLKYGIEILADIRGGKAGSRAFPHFNKEALSKSLSKLDIEYIHIPELGGRRGKQPNADNTTNGEWRLAAFKNYADYAYLSNDFQKGLKQLIRLHSKATVAYMCAEAVPWRCHRSIVTDYLLLVHKIDVCHILSMTQTLKAAPHQHAKLIKGKVCFPKTQ